MHLEIDHLTPQNSIDVVKKTLFSKTLEEEVQWLLQEGTMSSNFLNLERKTYPSNSLDAVVDKKGLHSSTEGILTVIKGFYDQLYSCHDTQTEMEVAEFLNVIPSLPKIYQDTRNLAAEISEKDILTAIKFLRVGKAPGCDGLTAEFYKAFEETLAHILVQVFAAVWSNGSLTAPERMAVIILLFKKGDSRLLASYRPISLTNADYKILAYVLSHLLSKHLTDIIAVNQMAYMSGRFIGTNIHYVQDTMEYFAVHSTQSAILFLDFKKAFDSVSYQFLFSLLTHIGCPPEFVKWVHIMYSDVVSSVRFFNWLTHSILLIGLSIIISLVQPCWPSAYLLYERSRSVPMVDKKGGSKLSQCR